MTKKKTTDTKIDIDVDWMADLLEKYSKKGDLEGFSEEFIAEMNTRGVDFLKNHVQQFAGSVMDDYNKERDYNEVVSGIWLGGFVMLRMLVGVSVAFVDYFRGMKISDDYRLDLREVLVALHAKACLTTNEIICLMENGFPNGAYSQWRSLYEVLIVSLFLRQHYSPELVQSYVDHGTYEKTKAFHEYELAFKKLGFDPPTEAEVKMNEQVKSDLKKKYDKLFFQPYGWAAEELKKLKLAANFRSIEEAVELSHWRPFYKHSSQGVHAGAQGLSSQLGVEDSDHILLIGKSYKHMLDPAQTTVISFGQLTVNLLLCAHHEKPLEQFHLPYLVAIINTLADRTRNAFVEIDKKLASAPVKAKVKPDNKSSSL